MKIEKVKKIEVYFEDLKDGTYFEFSGRIYIKCNICSTNINAFHAENHCSALINSNALVYPLTCKLVYAYKFEEL